MSKPRSFKHVWLSAVMADKSLGYDVRGLLGAICETIMQPDGMNVWAGQRYIAEQCGASQPTVGRLLAKAIRSGYVVKEERENQYGIVTAHLTPVIPKSDSDVNRSRSESESDRDSDSTQNPGDLNPRDSTQLASAEVGPRGPVSSDPEMALAIIAASGHQASVDQVIEWWPDKISEDEALAISESVDRGLYGLADARHLRLVTGIEDAGEFAYALALARDCAFHRLDRSLSAKQLLKIANRVRRHLDRDRPPTMLPAVDGSAASEWSAYPGTVTDVVGFIAGSILKALEQETVNHGG